MLGILAGILVGLGDIALLLLQEENKYIGAFIFVLALATIIQMDLNLYTGKAGFFLSDYKKQDLSLMTFFIKKAWYLIKVLIENLIGVASVFFLFLCVQPNNILLKAINIARLKFSCDIKYIFVMSILCGVCVYIACGFKNFKKKEFDLRPLIIILAIMCFILSGFRHCIADFPYFVLNLYLKRYEIKYNIFLDVIKFIFMILGNTIGAIIINLIWESAKPSSK